jgi:ribosomal protein S25
MRIRVLPVSDTAFEQVFSDLSNNPASTVRDVASRTGWSIGTVTNVTVHLRNEGSIKRGKNEKGPYILTIRLD